MRSMILAVLIALIAGCGLVADDGNTNSGTIGKGGLALSLPAPGSPVVGGFDIEVRKTSSPTNCGDCWGGCGGDGQPPCNPLEDRYCASLELENRPSGQPASLPVSPTYGHKFADHYFNVWPGNYCVRATAKTTCSTGGATVQQCSVPTSGPHTVGAGLTATEVVMTSNCDLVQDSGGLDVSVIVNRDPWIKSLVYNQSKYICANEPLKVTATAEDPDGDMLHWKWTGSFNSSQCSSATGVNPLESVLTCGPNAFGPGSWEMQVRVCDSPFVNNACPTLEAVLTFPVYVSCGGDCPACQQPDGGVN